MKNTFLLLSVLIASIYFYHGCSEDLIKNGGGGTIDTNILRTDLFCNILGGDTNDWCIDTTGGFSFGPACPNPSLTTTVWFYLPQDDTIRLTMRNSLGGSDSVLFEGPLMAGTHGQNIDGTNYLNTFRKVCINSKRHLSFEGCSSCGDIKFEQ